MPQIAVFIKELLNEDPFDKTFSSKLPERLETLNAAQLQGMYKHLHKTHSNSKFKPWKNANLHLLKSMKNILDERVKEFEKQNKKKQDSNLLVKVKRNLKKNIEQKANRVMELIEKASEDKARAEVKRLERQRQADERLEIVKKVWESEAIRITYAKYAAGFSFTMLLIIIIVYAVAFTNAAFIGGGISFVALITAAILYKAYKVGIVEPIVVTNEDLEDKVTALEEQYKEKAIQEMKEKEEQFKQVIKEEKAYRKKYKEEKLRKEEFERRLLEERRLQELAMAQEIIEGSIRSSNIDTLFHDDISSLALSYELLSLEESSVQTFDDSVQIEININIKEMIDDDESQINSCFIFDHKV